MKIEVTLAERSIWHAARGKWGIPHENGMAGEELAETIAAINHMSRSREGAKQEFIAELADAFVCSLQMIENNGLWDQFHDALEVSVSKMDAKLKADDPNYQGVS